MGYISFLKQDRGGGGIPRNIYVRSETSIWKKYRIVTSYTLRGTAKGIAATLCQGVISRLSSTVS